MLAHFLVLLHRSILQILELDSIDYQKWKKVQPFQRNCFYWMPTR